MALVLGYPECFAFEELRRKVTPVESIGRECSSLLEIKILTVFCSWVQPIQDSSSVQSFDMTTDSVEALALDPVPRMSKS